MAAETFLERIVAATQADLAERMARLPLAELQSRAAVASAPRDFAGALRPSPGGAARLIGEVKRASPSRGVLAERFDPVAQARAYARGGAAAISVLTEPHFFLGALEHLAAVRETVPVPVLRKDFILAPFQVYEARAAGADAVLLLCALLDDARLAELLALTRSLGMEALVEAHDEAEARRAVACGAAVIGANSRDLRTFAVDTDVVRHLRPLVPMMDRIFVAESGISDATGAARARAWGADAILVGEALMTAADPAAKAHELATAPGGASAELFRHAGVGPFVKLCGLTTTTQAALAAELGAEAVGLIFYPPSHRYVSREQARAIAAVASSAGLLAAGVFVNEAIDEVIAMRDDVGLSAIQLGGDETPVYCAELAARVSCLLIKSLRLRDDADLDRLDAYALAGATLLLDAHVPGMYGGSGTLGNWELARRAAARWPVILSGGLTPANVAPAIAAVGPRGVDVSSGIETAKVKDPDKMRAFVRAAREALHEEARP
ncbi:MAG TPA: indole-3-glycerol phosphate synthase TrpC [Ktedonobacterales bacterium]|nr:indole-3-glycerol phosphate synthase TrpC [Ktedonobacterales bacterium]